MPCSSIQKLCNAGEREWVTGQPMIPASRVRPVILMVPASYQQHAAAAQKIEQLQERQSENGEMVADPPLEQLHATTFEAVGADRAEQRVAFGGDVPVEKSLAERAHRHFRGARRVPELFVAADDTSRRRQDMGPAAQR